MSRPAWLGSLRNRYIVLHCYLYLLYTVGCIAMCRETGKVFRFVCIGDRATYSSVALKRRTVPGRKVDGQHISYSISCRGDLLRVPTSQIQCIALLFYLL